MGRRYFRLYRYVAKEFTLSFAVSFSFFFFIFFVNQLPLLAEDILSKHVPFSDVLLLIVYSLPLILSLSIPFGALVGALMAVGRFSSDNEVLAFRACGVPDRKLFLPLLILGIAFSLVSFVLNDYFLPRGTLNLGKLYRNLIYRNPEIELESYSIKRYQNSIIVTGNVKGNTINRLLIFDKTPEQYDRIITASYASLVENKEQEGVISLKLENVFSHTLDPKKRNQFEYLVSGGMLYNILLKDIVFSIRNPGPSEMTSYDVYLAIQKKQKDLNSQIQKNRERIGTLSRNLSAEYRGLTDTLELKHYSLDSFLAGIKKTYGEIRAAKEKKITDRSLDMYKLEFYKKFAVPFSCFFFIIFAYPVGLFTRRSGRSVGFGIGVLVATFYWGMLFAGQTMGIRLSFPAFPSMWIPNAVILLLGVSAFFVRAKR
ncbi:MAG: YjgP/YjgQ family permease [Spirochaetales bacterium]|nr:MAG: YjgP/YjgQ family permease [Spirochaetales bacterium]